MRHSVDRQFIDFCTETVLQNGYANWRKLEKSAANLLAHCTVQFVRSGGLFKLLVINGCLSFCFMTYIKTIVYVFK